MGDSQIYSCWVPNTPIKSSSSKPQLICMDGGENLVNKMSAPDSTNSGGVDNGSRNWEAALSGKPQPDANATRRGDHDAKSNTADSIFSTGFEGTRFEGSFTTPWDNKFVSVGQNMWINSHYLPRTPSGDSTPPHHSFDFNSPCKGPMYAVSGVNSSSMFAPITPDQSKKTENSWTCSYQTTDKQLSKPVYAVSSVNSSSLFAPLSNQSTKNGNSSTCSNQTTDKQLAKPVNAVSNTNSSYLFAPITPDQSKKTDNSQACSNEMMNNQLSKSVDAVSSASSSYLFSPITPNQSKNTEKFEVCSNQMTDKQVAKPADAVSSENSSFVFAPITPDQSKKTENSQVCSNLMIDEQLASGSSVAAVSTQVEENHNPDTDLQKIPEPKLRRKKHRPKVVKEGQAKRTRKPATLKPEGNMETPTGKRKYVRKNGVNKTAGLPEVTPQNAENKETPRVKRKYVRKNGVNKTAGLSTGEVTSNRTDMKTQPYARKSCKKRLNFDENRSVVEGTSFSRPTSNENTEAQAQNFHIGVESKSAVQLGQGSELMDGNTKADLVQEMGAREQNESRKGKCRIVFSDQTHDKQEPPVEMMMTSNIQSAPSLNDSNFSNNTCLFERQEARGSKRGHEYTINGAEEMCTNVIGSHYNSLTKYEAIFPKYVYDDNRMSDVHFSTADKEKKPRRRHNTATSGTSSSKAVVEHSIKEATFYTSQNAYLASYTQEINFAYPAAQFYSREYHNGTQSLLKAQLQQQALEYRLLLERSRMMNGMICNGASRLCSLSSTVGNIECHQAPGYLAGEAPPCGDLQTYQSSCPSHAGVEIKVAKARKPRKNRSQKTGVARKKKPTVDEITEYLKHLHINPKYREQNAVVLYGGVGTVVPFEGLFNPIKKRRERAKVDLDDETNRVWRLLLENINSEGIDGTDEEKAKWWEEERRVFQGRADSFIARMHLVQGDRRFTPWKGSVVDSVVGVFLTQNVSDHASSSAFMSLAAHFPLKTEGSYGTCSKETSIFVKEQEVRILEPEDTIKSSYANGSSTTFMELLQMAESQGGFQSQGAKCVPSYAENVQHFMYQSEDGTNGFYNPNAASSPIIPSVEDVPSYERLGEENSSSSTPNGSEENCASERSEITVESASSDTLKKVLNVSFQKESLSADVIKCNRSQGEAALTANSCIYDNPQKAENKQVESSVTDPGSTPGTGVVNSELKKGKTGKQTQNAADWDILRLKAQENGKKDRTANTMDSLDWEAVWRADVDDVADTIKARGMNNVLAGRIQAFLNRLVTEHRSIDLEWLRDVPPDKAKEYLLSIRGLGLKSVECVRLLTLHHLAFPVDTNVGRIAVRLGWVPLQPLPESLQLHLLELYPVLESIQQYLWPRLCKLDQKTLYELHYQMITFGKVFCTKSKPNCNACPMRGECRHFASAFASARLALPGPEEKRIVNATENKEAKQRPSDPIGQLQLPEPQPSLELQAQPGVHIWEPTAQVRATYIVEEPIIEVPNTPEPEIQVPESDVEDAFPEDPEEIPTIRLNLEKFTQNLQSYMEHTMELQEADVSKALVALSQEAASIPMPKLKNVNQLRTEHQVYELPDSHPLLERMDRREPDDPCSYLLAIWTPGETANSFEQPESRCSSQESGNLCDVETCFSCNSIREANSQTVRGTLLIPCRTAMRGSFPLNGTYFQVNEVFADHESSIKPIDVPRSWIWNLPRRMVYFGTSIPTIFKGLSTESIQYCFWKGFVCVRGFDQKTRAPRPLMARLHFPASKLPKASGKTDEKKV